MIGQRTWKNLEIFGMPSAYGVAMPDGAGVAWAHPAGFLVAFQREEAGFASLIAARESIPPDSFLLHRGYGA